MDTGTGLFEADYLPPDARRFLDLLPSRHRARCGHLLHKAAVGGAATADALLTAACKAARVRIGWHAHDALSDRADAYHRFLIAVHSDAPGAKAYAEFVLRWQCQPPIHRVAVKRARAQAATMAQRLKQSKPLKREVTA